MSALPKPILMLAIALLPFSAQADSDMTTKDALKACLQEKVVLTNPQLESATFGRSISVDVTNNLKWAIAGIRIEYTIKSEDRSVPWKKDAFAVSIPGGIEPGETRDIGTSVSVSRDTPDDAILTATVVDVSDPEERQLVKEVTIIGWGDGKSPMTCE
ncbi:MAG: hypothetical protein Alpg2KO_06680 [Alphaproteobacteria bacterium]